MPRNCQWAAVSRTSASADNPRSGQEFTVVAPGKGQAEEEPKAGQERHRHHAQKLPVGSGVENLCIGRQPEEKTFHRQGSHARGEGPVDNGTALVPSDGRGQAACAEACGKGKNAGGAHWLLQFTAASKTQPSGWHKQNCSWRRTPLPFPLALSGTAVDGVTPDDTAMLSLP